MSMRFSICVEMIFPELPPEARLEEVVAAGFNAVEFWDWKTKDVDALARRCGELGLAVTTMSGQRAGSPLDPQEFELYRNELVASIAAARRFSCPTLMLLTNALDADGRVVCPYSDIAPEDKKDNCVRAFSALAPLAAESGIRLLLEPLNTVVDHPGYWLDDAGRAFEIIREVESPHLRVLYDLYHMQTMGRNVRRDIEGNLDAIGYFHAADVPGRHEPGTGTMDYAGILALLDESGYEGTFGFEFTPMRSSEEALLAIYDLVEPHL